MWAFVLHTTAASIMTYGYRSLDALPLQAWIKQQKGGHAQFLTMQGLAGSWFYMILSIICDLYPSLKTRLQDVKRVLLMIALPLAFVVTSIYWSLYIFFPTLILRPEEPTGSEPTSSSTAPKLMRIPLHIDLSVHAVPLITLLVDFFLFERKFAPRQTRMTAPAIVFVYGIWYASFVEYCSRFNGTFPYPFLTVNPFGVRVVIYTVVAGLALASLRLLNALHS
ncbi:FAR-17a/AIG1-like protein [Phlebopus sp. FC_14]|nr:FAR-17a/AIG1-like protein [Phlebopus sp. FC_14]